MAVSSSRGRSDLQWKWKDRENPIVHERTKVWSRPHNELNPNNSSFTENVPKRVTVSVVYYLSRNGQLQHPHFMEVPLSSPHGLFLRDVIGRLNLLRGKAMASQYSWSSKRSYKNGYVWHDLEEDDAIHPVHGGEYVLKGSEILEVSSKYTKTVLSCSAKNTPDVTLSGRNRRRNQSWGAIDLNDYNVYKGESSNASTQTEDKRSRRSMAASIKEETEDAGNETVNKEEIEKVVLSREEISPPPLDSSPETFESLIKADGRLTLALSKISLQTIHQNHELKKVNQNQTAGKMKAPSVIMSLISCGSLSFRDCGAAAVKDHGMSLVSHSHSHHHRVGGKVGEMILIDNHDDEIEKNVRSKFAKMAMEDNKYFSGSLLMEQINKDDYISANKLKRSSSYHADRSFYLKRGAKEEEGISAMCMPRRPKTQGKSIFTNTQPSPS